MTQSKARILRGPLRLPAWTPLAFGFAVLAIPTMLSLARQTWDSEAGAHGPLVLMTGIWLLVHSMHKIQVPAGHETNWLFLGLGLSLAGALYVLGRAFGFLAAEAVGLYGVFICLAYRMLGTREIKRLAFPLFYLAFLIPLPGGLTRMLTEPLKTGVSWAAAELMQMLGFPVAREGVSLTVAQYQFLVEDACSGLNSLTGLVAISLFYIYVLHRGSRRLAAALLLIVIPVAIIVNIIRVLTLILLTYYQGDAVAQGFMHGTTGLILYGGAILFLFMADQLFQQARWRKKHV